jgi:hypothetical protein
MAWPKLSLVPTVGATARPRWVVPSGPVDVGEREGAHVGWYRLALLMWERERVVGFEAV